MTLRINNCSGFGSVLYLVVTCSLSVPLFHFLSLSQSSHDRDVANEIKHNETTRQVVPELTVSSTLFPVSHYQDIQSSMTSMMTFLTSMNSTCYYCHTGQVRNEWEKKENSKAVVERKSKGSESTFNERNFFRRKWGTNFPDWWWSNIPAAFVQQRQDDWQVFDIYQQSRPLKSTHFSALATEYKRVKVTTSITYPIQWILFFGSGVAGKIREKCIFFPSRWSSIVYRLFCPTAWEAVGAESGLSEKPRGSGLQESHCSFRRQGRRSSGGVRWRGETATSRTASSG